MASEIKYNGEVIATPIAGQTATLKCAGKKMASDIAVVEKDIVLQEKTAKVFNETVYPDEGYDGLKIVRVRIPLYNCAWRL